MVRKDNLCNFDLLSFVDIISGVVNIGCLAVLRVTIIWMRSVCYLIDNFLVCHWTLSQSCGIVGVTKEQEVTK